MPTEKIEEQKLIDENNRKAAEYEALLDTKIVADAEEKLQRALLFDPQDIVRKAKDIREVFDKDLKTIRYVHLSYDELIELTDKCKDDRERSLQLLLRQLGPANPGLTEQDIRKMPYEVVVRLLLLLQGEGSFFYHPPAKATK